MTGRSPLMPGGPDSGRWPAEASALLAGAVGRWLQERPAGRSPLVVAIDGHGAAGKSTIAGLAAAAAGATLVHTDDFFTGSGAPAGSPDTGVQGQLAAQAGHAEQAEQALGRYYDWRRLRAQALEPLLEGRAVSFRRFDWDRGSGLDGTVRAQPHDVIMLEGVFSTAPVLSDLVSRTVLVLTPEAERLVRLRGRVPPGEWDEQWLAAERAYFSLVRPVPSFDLVLHGADPPAPWQRSCAGG